MPIDLDDFGRLRPYLYHLTAQENVARIRGMGRLESASALLHAAGRTDLLTTRRKDHLAIVVGDVPISIRDQAPLHAGNMALDPDWSPADFVAYLNRRVFFWPGSAGGPISYGDRHYDRYAHESPAILRMRFDALRMANPGLPPLFCRFNSGSPRWSYGRPSPRSAKTFVPGEDADFRATQVVEVTFADGVALPPNVEIGRTPRGPWQTLGQR
jgi:hypothetical protein